MSLRSFECLSGSIFGQRTIQVQASGDNEKNLRQRVPVGERLEGRESLGSGSQSSVLLGM